MKIFDAMLLDIAYVALPLTFYLLYLMYARTFKKEENNLIFAMTIFSMLYITIKFNIPLFEGFPLLLINIPLILAIYKKSNIATIISSVIIAFYYYNFYNGNLILIMLEYTIYYILSLKIKNINTFILIFCIIKFFTTYIQIGETINLLIAIFSLYLSAILTIYQFKQAEEVLKLHKNLKNIIEEKDFKKSLFNITHEIKNPIAVCKGYLDMFDIENKEKSKEYIKIIKEEINRTLILLEDFLSINKIKINKDLLDINMLLEEVCENMKIYCKNQNINIELNTKDNEIYIEGDYNRLTQVLVNIIKNSTEANTKNIKIWTNINQKEIEIHIKDDGIGMSKENLENLKKPFFTTKTKGSGLGVALSNEIILLHKGTLDYRSKENEYTEVIITLPVNSIYE